MRGKQWLCVASALGLALAMLTRPTHSAPAALSFAPHLIAQFPDGYQLAIADVNGDGKPDVIALSTRARRVAWYDNPVWKEHPIITTLPDPISVAPAPAPSGKKAVTRMALATDFALNDSTSGGRVWILDRPPSGDGEWTATEIDAIPTSHRLKWADLDGDGEMELVNAPLLGRGAKAPDYAVPATLVFYKRAGRKWNRYEVADDLRLFHGFAVVRWGGDRRDSLLTASAEGVQLLRSEGAGQKLSWTRTQLGEGGSSEVCLGRLAHKRFLATIEPWHGNKVVVYTETPAGLWKRRVLDETFSEGHAIACGDLDGAGDDEIVAGYRGKGSSLYAYKALDADGDRWQRIPIDEGGMAASGCALADINGDGRLDVVAVGATVGNLKWYENLAGW